jgi:hypothetical protein
MYRLFRNFSNDTNYARDLMCKDSFGNISFERGKKYYIDILWLDEQDYRKQNN